MPAGWNWRWEGGERATNDLAFDELATPTERRGGGVSRPVPERREATANPRRRPRALPETAERAEVDATSRVRSDRRERRRKRTSALGKSSAAKSASGTPPDRKATAIHLITMEFHGRPQVTVTSGDEARTRDPYLGKVPPLIFVFGKGRERPLNDYLPPICTAIHAGHNRRNRPRGRSPTEPNLAWRRVRSLGSGLSGVAEELPAGQSEQPPLVLIR
jgi:hypothetical protein